MKRKQESKRLMAVVLTILMIVSCLVPAYARESDTTVIHVTDYGADPTGSTDSVVAVQKAIEAARNAGGNVVLDFPYGEYHFYPDDAEVRRIYISNSTTAGDTALGENSIRTIGIYLEDMENVTLQGNGSTFMFHGKMMSFVTKGCKNVTIENLSYDFAVPYSFDLTVEEVGDKEAILYIPECYEYENTGTQLLFHSEKSPKTGLRYWSYSSYGYDLVTDLTTGRIERKYSGGNYVFGNVTSIEDIGNSRVKLHYSTQPNLTPGINIQIHETIRDNPSLLLWESKDIVIKDIEANFLHSFGIVGQFSENITVDNVNFDANPLKGTKTSANADMMQISGCKGLITVTNCNFANPHDDPINIHGTFLQISAVLAPNKIRVQYVQPETYGFPNYYVGDEIEFVRRSDMSSVDESYLCTVTEVVNPDERSYDKTERKYITLTLDKNLPSEITSANCSSYVVENITYTPEVLIENCTFAESPVRGILCTTRKKVIIRNNYFENMNMAAIYISDDANSWYESGYFRDVTIEGNTFVNCGESNTPIILIEPIVQQSTGRTVHKNLTIKNNTFYVSRNQNVLNARSVDGIAFTGNTILSDQKAKLTISVGDNELTEGQITGISSDITNSNYTSRLFSFSNCKNIVMEDNTYGSGLNCSIGTSGTELSEFTCSGEDAELPFNKDYYKSAEDYTVEYEVSNPSIVKLNAENGVISAVSAGTAEIQAYAVSSSGDVCTSNRITVTVRPATVSGSKIEIQSETDTINEKGATLQLHALYPATGETADVTWSVVGITGGASSIASINENGELTAISGGAVYVKAVTADGSEALKVITVSLPTYQLNVDIASKNASTIKATPDGGIEITSESLNGFFDSSNNPRNVVRFALPDNSENVTATVKMTGATKSTYEETGFGILKDYDNFVAVQRKNHLGTVLVTESNAKGSEAVRTGYYNSNTVWFKIVKTGNTFEGYYSIDNAAWTKIGSLSNTTVGNDGLVVALWVATGNGTNKFVFEDIIINGVEQEYLKVNTVPVASNAVLSSDHATIGSNLSVAYDYSDAESDANAATTAVWYMSDTPNGEYELVPNIYGTTITATSVLSNKYVKAAVIPVDANGSVGVLSPLSGYAYVSDSSSEAKPLGNRITEAGGNLKFTAVSDTDCIWNVTDPFTGGTAAAGIIDNNGFFTAAKNGVARVKAVNADDTVLDRLVTVQLDGTTFDGEVINSVDGTWNIKEDGSLAVNCLTKYAFFNSRNQEENLFLIDLGEVVENCEATIKMQGATVNTYEETGFGFIKDVDNWVAVQRKHHLGTVLVTESNATGSEDVRTGYYNANTVWFKISKAGDTYKGWYSTDNANWTSIGTVTNNTVGNDGVKLGIWVAAGKASPVNQFTFSQLTINNEAVSLGRPVTAPVNSEVAMEGNAASGKTLGVTYTYSDAEDDAMAKELITWYEADSIDGSYKLIKTAPTLSLTAEHAGKYVMASVITVDEKGAVSEEAFTAPAFVTASSDSSNANIGRVTIKNDTGSIISNNARADVTEYEVTTASRKITIEAVAEDAGAVCTVASDGKLSVGANRIVITVTSENGRTKEYVYHITCLTPGSISSKLESISSDVMDVYPQVNDVTTKYFAGVTKEVMELPLRLKAVGESSEIDVKVNEKEIASGEGILDATIPLSVGMNRIYVTVTAENGTSTDYRLIVVRNGYTEAGVSSVEIGGKAYADFSTDVNEYDIVMTEEEAANFKISADLISEYASACVAINNVRTEGTLATGVLHNGYNKVVVAVKAENYVTNKYYTFHITVTSAKNAYLSELSIVDSLYDYSFDPETMEYTVDIDAAKTALPVSITALESEAKIELFYGAKCITAYGSIETALDVATSFADIKVRVTSPDGSSIHVYSVTLRKVVYLSDIEWKSASTGVETGPNRDLSIDGNPIKLKTRNGYPEVFAKGIGSHSTDLIVYDLSAYSDYDTVETIVGCDYETSTAGQMQFTILVDGVQKAQSSYMMREMFAEKLVADIIGASELTLTSDQLASKNSDHADWADAKLVKYADKRDNAVVITAPREVSKDEEFTITVVADRQFVPVIRNEAGSKMGATILSSTVNEDGLYVVDISFSIGTVGERRIFSVSDKTTGDELGTFEIRVIKYVPESGIVSVTAPASAACGTSFETTVVATKDLIKYRFENEKGNVLGTQRVAKTINGDYTETVYSLNVETAGSREITFKADYDKCSIWPFSKSFDIEITNALMGSIEAPKSVLRYANFEIEITSNREFAPVLTNELGKVVASSIVSVVRTEDGLVKTTIRLNIGTAGKERTITVADKKTGIIVGTFAIDVTNE